MKKSFFAQQESARQRTKYLVASFHGIVFITAAITTLFYILFIQAHAGMEEDLFFHQVLFHKDNFKVFAIVYLMIVGVSWVRSLPLQKGGAYVAKMVGGREISYDTKDLKERQLINIVEEMGIASGMTLPRVFVLDDELSINAFAAGTKINNACVAVSKGALEKLNRDELQGVVAHEFSHILNGDMALNIHLLGYLYGLTSIADAGRIIIRSSNRSRNNKNNGAPLFGVGLFLIGSLGYFFAFLLKAGVSRDRERLADASAVQFTRNPDGIGGALRKIWKENFNKLASPRSAEISHFYLHWPQPFLSFLATHPPILERIKNIGISSEGISNQREATRDFNQLEAISQFQSSSSAEVDFNPIYVAYAFYLWFEASPGIGPIDAVMRWNPSFDRMKMLKTYESLGALSAQDRFRLLERSVARLRGVEAPVITEMLGQMKALIEEDRRISHREFLFYYYLGLTLRPQKPKKILIAQDSLWQNVEVVCYFFATLLNSSAPHQFTHSVFSLLGRTPGLKGPYSQENVRSSLSILSQARPLQRLQVFKAFREIFSTQAQSAEILLSLELLALILEIPKTEHFTAV